MNEYNEIRPDEEEEVEIDLMEYVRKLWMARKVLLKAAGIGAVVGLIIAFSIPRQYTVQVTLAPESGRSIGNSQLSGVASMLGFGAMSFGNDIDALNVTLFPNIVGSTPFVLDLFDERVRTIDGEMDTTFVAYLDELSSPWWSVVLSVPGVVIGEVKALFADEEETGEGGGLNPFQLTKEQSVKVEFLRKLISASVDKKTGVTTVYVTMQDPLVAATIANKVIAKLQEAITVYRVSKTQQNCDYLEQLYKDHQKEYYEAQQRYADYVDGNRNLNLQSARVEGERLQNDMNLAYQVYSQVATQLQVARAKVQEAKPVFAVVEPATVPLLPSGTGKKIILIGFVFLAVAGTSAWILFGKDFFDNLKRELKEPQ